MRFDTAEKEEFERTAVVHAESLLRVAKRLLGDRSAAEDAVQETLLSGWRSFDQFERSTNCRAWLFKIMLRIIGKHRRRQLTLPIVKLPAGRDFDDLLTAPTASVQTNSELLAAVSSLRPEKRTVLLLAIVEGFTCREISTMLDLPIGTVMSRLSRARAEVRRWLGRSEQGFDVTAEDSSGYKLFVVGDLRTEETQALAVGIIASLT
jgi:RNA polymerase sigma-70 factor (ECF subfamily)